MVPGRHSKSPGFMTGHQTRYLFIQRIAGPDGPVSLCLAVKAR